MESCCIFSLRKENNLEGWHAFLFFTRNLDVQDESFETQFTAFLEQDDGYRSKDANFSWQISKLLIQQDGERE